MSARFNLTDEEWAPIAPLLPQAPQRAGTKAVGTRGYAVAGLACIVAGRSAKQCGYGV